MKALLALSALVAATPSVYAKESCPAAVKNAANKAYAGSKIKLCKQERADGKAQYEVKLKIADGKKLILDVAPKEPSCSPKRTSR